MKVPAPVPERPMPESGSPAAFLVVTTRVPWLGSSEPLEGETMLWMTTGWRAPGQLVVEVIRT